MGQTKLLCLPHSPQENYLAGVVEETGGGVLEV